MPILSREYFLSLYQKLNQDEAYNTHDLSNSIVPIRADNSDNRNLKQSIIRQFAKEGFVLVEFTNNKYFLDVLDWASAIIGPPMSDSANVGKPYSKIIAEPDGKYFANTQYTQPLHTDDAHVLNTPRIITLYCEKQAGQGGITTLVKFSDIYQKIKMDSPQTLGMLYAENAIQIDGVKGIIVRPFFYHLENDLSGIVFSVFVNSIQSNNEEIIDVFKQVVNLSHQKENQIRFRLAPGQLLIIDNYRVLHGRTRFDISDERVLYRFCFKENFLHKETVFQ